MSNSRRSSSTRRGYYRTLAVFVTLTMVISALMAFEPTSAWPGQIGQAPISVGQVGLIQNASNLDEIDGGVLVQSRGVSIADARVSATFTYPDGRTVALDGTTSRAGLMLFSQPVEGNGTYTLAVTDIKKDGYQYTPRLNKATSTSVTISNASQPDPDPNPNPDPDDGNDNDSGNGGGDGTCTVPAGADVWHEPTDHEHGEAPPAWANEFSCQQFGHPVIFGGDEQTPNENQLKHNAFIGFNGSANGQQLYFRVHAQSNPMGRAVQFHSFEAYVLDAAGNVSMTQGWLDYGIFPQDRGVRGTNGDPSQRPAIFGATEQVGSEQWYSRPGGPAARGYAGGSTSEITGAFVSGWLPDTSLTFLGATTTFSPNEADYVYDSSQWPLTGRDGTKRVAGFHWYTSRMPSQMLGTEFYATQFGQIAQNGLNDPICSGTTTVHGKTYQNQCLYQKVAETLQDVNINPSHDINCPNCVIPSYDHHGS